MDLSDEALIESFRKTKDSNYFKSLVRRYQNRIYSAALRMLGSNQEAEEVVQETYIKVHQNLDKFRRQSSFAAWVFRIAHNICVDTLRERQRKGGFQLVALDPQGGGDHEESAEGPGGVVSQVADASPCPEVELTLNEQTQLIESSLKSLPDSQRAVIVLCDIEGFSYEEIAEIVGASVGTVRSRIHYGRLKLRELLEPYFSSSNISPVGR